MNGLKEMINAITQYINTQTASSGRSIFPITEVVAIGAAVLSLVGLVYTVKKSAKLQNANARIEWIQKVRQATAEFVTACHEVLLARVNNSGGDELSKLREKTQLLILYFGPEAQNKKTVDLLCEASNDGKNREIVNSINEIKNYLVNDKRTVLQILNKRKRQVEKDLYENNISPDEEEYDEYYPSLNEVLEEDLKNIERAEVKYAEVFQKIDTLGDAMRIYLKLEWNKAKKGK